MRLAHLHLPGLTCYTYASLIQEALVQRHFLYKDSLRSARISAGTSAGTLDSTITTPSTSTPIPPPDPTILTFTCHPTYTVGRRYLSPPPSSTSKASSVPSRESKQTSQISPTQRAFLTGPPSSNLAAFHSTPRGGDLTFHGPGQLTVYPVLDLRRTRLTPRAYISLLQDTVMRTCARLSVPDTTTTENPGVWIRGGERKICAVGVQVRRGITGHGIALNVRDQEIQAGSGYELEDGREGGMLSWGFSRIVACGLEGKSITWLTREGARADLQVGHVAHAFVEQLAKSLGGVGDIYNTTEQDITVSGFMEKIRIGSGH